MKRFGTLYLFLVLLVGFYIAAVAQAPVASILATAKAAAARYPDADAVYLWSDCTLRISPDGTAQETIHQTILLLTKDGVSNYREVEQDYPPSDQTVDLDYARTITMNGVVTPVPPSAVRRALVSDLMRNKLGNTVPGQVDTTALKFTVPDISPNTILDYQFTQHYSKWTSLYAMIWYLGREEPVMNAKFQLVTPRITPIKWKVYNTSIAPVVQTGSTTLTYSFAVRDVPAIPQEPNMPDWYVVAPRVAVSGIASWDQLASRVQELFSQAETVDQFVQRVTDGLIAGCNTAEEKIAAINRFMRTEVQYLPIQHEEPLPAPITLAYKEGDCKDQTALMIAMLKAVGITAYPVLINPYQGGDIDFSFPGISAPVWHAIVAVPHAGGWWFFDPSADPAYAPGYLPLMDQDKHGILFLGRKDRLWIKVHTPVSSPDDTCVQEDIVGTISLRGDLTEHVVTRLAGREAAGIRYLWSIMNRAQLTDAYGKMLSAKFGNSMITKFNMDFVTSDDWSLPIDDPVTVEFDFTAVGFVQTDSRSRWFTVPYPRLFADAAHRLHYIGGPKRHYPFIAPPEKISSKIVIAVPDSFIVRLPADVDITNAVGNLHIHYTDEGGKLVVERSLTVEKAIIPPAQFADLRALFAAAVHDGGSRIYLDPKEETTSR